MKVKLNIHVSERVKGIAKEGIEEIFEVVCQAKFESC